MSDPVSRHNEAELERLRNDIGQSLVDKVRDVLVRANIPVPMDPKRNIYKSISYVIDNQTGIIYVGSDLPYAPIIEWGRDPGLKPPPHEPIKQWVIKKLGKSEEEADSIAWAVVKKIQKEGTAAKYPFRIGLEEWIRGA